MRRHLLGLFGIALVALGVVLLAVYGWSQTTGSAGASIALRAGITLCAVWLALPQVIQLSRKAPLWLIALVGLCFVVFVIYPKSIVVVGPLLAIVLITQFLRYLFTPAKRRKPKQAAAADAGDKS